MIAPNDEHDEHAVMIAKTAEELNHKLLDYEYNRSGSCRFALSQALNEEELFVESIDQHARFERPAIVAQKQRWPATLKSGGSCPAAPQK